MPSTCTAVGGHDHRQHDRRRAELDRPGRTSGVGSLSRRVVRQSGQLRSRRAGSNFGGTIETLSAPPDVTTTSLTVGHHRRAVREHAGTQPADWRPTRGPSPAARCRPASGSLRTARISGIPTISGEYPVTFTVTDSNFLSSDALSDDLHRPDRRARVLGGRQRRRDLQLRRRPVLRLDRQPAPQCAHHRHGGDARRRRLLAAGLRRRDLRLRRCRLLRLDRRHAPQRTDRRHDAHSGRWRATGWSPPTAASSAFGDAGFYGSTGWPAAGQADRRHGLDASTGGATGSSRPTAGSSPSATPASSDRPVGCRSESPSWP